MSLATIRIALIEVGKIPLFYYVTKNIGGFRPK